MAFRRFASVALACALALQGGRARAQDAAPVPRSRIQSEIPDVEVTERTSTFVMAPLHRGSWTQEREYLMNTVCARTPCEAPLLPGDHALVLRDRHGYVLADTMLHLDGPSIIDGRRVDHTATRVAGGIVFLAGVAGGIAVTAVGANERSACGESTNACTSQQSQQADVILGVGITTIILGVVTGGVLLGTRDELSFSVAPLFSPTASLRTGRESGGAASITPGGLAVAMRF